MNIKQALMKAKNWIKYLYNNIYKINYCKEKIFFKMKSEKYDYSKLKRCGNNIFISAGVVFRRPELICIGNNVAIDHGVYITTGVEINDYIHIAPYVTIIGGKKVNIIMDNFTTIAAGSRLICSSDNHMGEGLVGPTIPQQFQDTRKTGNIIFKQFASIGTNVIVMPGITLAEGSVVGSNSLLLEDTKPWSVYIGTPAKKIKDRPRNKMKNMAKELGYEF